MSQIEHRLARITIGELRPLTAKIELVDYDPAWPTRYATLATLIRTALGPRIRLLEHVGSTSVANLCAKPIIDILLAVADSADEPAYVPDLTHAGFILRIRERDWYEHRCFQHADIDLRLHVFAIDCPEIGKMLAFRDVLRRNAVLRDRYAAVKRDLATREWKYMDEYAQAKSAVIADILAPA